MPLSWHKGSCITPSPILASATVTVAALSPRQPILWHPVPLAALSLWLFYPSGSPSQ